MLLCVTGETHSDAYWHGVMSDFHASAGGCEHNSHMITTEIHSLHSDMSRHSREKLMERAQTVVLCICVSLERHIQMPTGMVL